MYLIFLYRAFGSYLQCLNIKAVNENKAIIAVYDSFANANKIYILEYSDSNVITFK